MGFWTTGPKPRLSAEQMAAFAQIVEAGPDREKDGVLRWRRIDLKRVIAEKFGVDFHPRYVGKLLKKLGFSHISARPRHPAQDERIVEAFKKFPARVESPPRERAGGDADRNLVPALTRSRAEAGRERLAVSAPKLALKHRLRELRRHHRRRLQRMAQSHRRTRTHQIHPNASMG
jgi:hypothetical protein